MNIQRDIYPLRGGESQAKPQWPLPVLDQTSSQFTSTTFNAGTDFTIPAGAAGTAITIQLKYGQILGTNGRVGSLGNTTLVLGGAFATTLTTEVAFIANSTNTAGDVSTLANGRYMVDYETGIIYAKKADSGTTGTATYSYWLKSSVSSGGGTGASASQVQGSTAAGAAPLGNPVLVSGLFETTPATLTTGQQGDLHIDANQNLKVAEQFAPQYENNSLNIAQTGIKGTPTHITSATTTTAKSGAGILHSITINKAVAAATITVFDNTAGSGTVLALITFGAALLSDPPNTATYDIAFTTGCTIVTSGATDITVSTI